MHASRFILAAPCKGLLTSDSASYLFRGKIGNHPPAAYQPSAEFHAHMQASARTRMCI